MPAHLLYRDDIETIEPDEQDTHNKIIELMTQGMHLVRENTGKKILLRGYSASLPDRIPN
jgi:hypothetical protein